MRKNRITLKDITNKIYFTRNILATLRDVSFHY